MKLSTRSPLFLLMLAAVCCQVSPEGAEAPAPTLPRVEESAGTATVRLDEGLVLRYGIQPFRLHAAQIGSVTLEPTPSSSSRFRMGEHQAALARATAWGPSVGGVDFELDVFPRPGLREDFPGADEVRRMVETVTPVTLGDARGYHRAVHQHPDVDPHRGGRDMPPLVWFGPDELVPQASARTVIREHYGHSTVAAPGITYELRTRALPDGSQVWVFWSYHHYMNQANNPGIDPRLEETVLVTGPRSELDMGEVLTALVDHPRDRERLLELYAR